MRSFVAAAIQVPPAPGPLTPESVKANLDTCVGHLDRCVAANGAELLVLPEAASTGFTPGVEPQRLWDLVSEVPGPVTEPVQEAARRLGVHVVFGTYERGPQRGTVYNTAAVVGDTPLARLGLQICFDGDYPELARIEAVRGAEVICRPSALLRSADIWELTNRARAYDNHVFVVAANATGVDPAGVIYFGNSMIVTPVAEVVARAASHAGWVSARLDPATAMAALTPGSSVPQRFDHLADRNLALIENHLDDLRRPAQTSFPYERP